MPACVRHLCIALAVLPAPMLWAEPVRLTLVDGHTIAGDIADWATQKIVVVSEGKAHTVTPNELLAIHIGNKDKIETEDSSPWWIELSDGSQLPFVEFSVHDRTALVLTPLAEDPLGLPANQIQTVQFTQAGRTAIDESSADQSGDFIVIAKKDSDETETLTGIIGDVTTEQVHFTWEGESIPVKLSKVAAIGFHQSESPEREEPLCVLSLTSGASLQVRTISVQGDYLEVSTIGGVNLKLPFVEVTEADYSAGKLTYLSDMEPLKSRWTPLIALPAAAATIKDYGVPRRNVSFTGSPLALLRYGDSDSDKKLTTYDKGLALRSRTELEYRLPKNMRRFVATAGIDPETRGQGNVLLSIEVDGQRAFEQEIDGQQAPADIAVDVTDRQRLKILVDYGKNLDTGDRLHLVEARLVK